MEGLMEIADKMQDEFQRDEPFVGIGAGVGKLGGELLDLVDDASRARPFDATVLAGRGGCPKQARQGSGHQARR
jgi:hypothetical protein